MTTLLIDFPSAAESARAVYIFAHGAGAPMDSDFMEAVTRRFLEHNIAVVRFEFPYMAKRRSEGKKSAPNRKPVLEATWHEVFNRVSEDPALPGPIFIGGKSMGGRVATLVASELASAGNLSGVIVFGYPFHPPGKPDNLRVAHLQSGAVPHLILQGTRDALGNQAEAAGYRLGQHVRCEWLEDGDHSLKPRVKSGFTLDQHLDSAVQQAADFIEDLV